MLVRVERHRLAVLFDILASCLHVSKGALTQGHLELHQLAGRIIDVDQQGALRPVLLEPYVDIR